MGGREEGVYDDIKNSWCRGRGRGGRQKGWKKTRSAEGLVVGRAKRLKIAGGEKCPWCFMDRASKNMQRVGEQGRGEGRRPHGTQKC